MMLTIYIAVLLAATCQGLVLPARQGEAKASAEDQQPETRAGERGSRAGGFAFMNPNQAVANHQGPQFEGNHRFQVPVLQPADPSTSVVVPDIPIETLFNPEGEEVQSVVSETEVPQTTGVIITDVASESGENHEEPIITESITQPTDLLEPTGASLSPPASTMGNIPYASPNIFDHPVETGPPPSSIPRRADHPVPRKGIYKKAPIGTNKFYANFFLEDQTTPCYAHPYSLTWSAGVKFAGSWGMAISHTEASMRFWGPDPYNIGGNNYFGHPVGVYAMIISAAELGEESVLTSSSISAFGLTVHLRPSKDAAPVVQFPVVQGMGFVTASYFGSTPVFHSGVLFRKLTKAEDHPRRGVYKFIVELEDNSKWYIYAVSSCGSPLDIELESQHQLRATSGFHGFIQVAKETNPDALSAEGIYDQSVGAYPVTLKMKGHVEDSSGQYTFKWIKGGHQSSKLLMWAFPHHVQGFDAETAGKMTGLKILLTTKGMATAVLSDSWTMLEPDLPVDMAFAPWDPDRGTLTLPAGVNETIYTIAQQEMSQNIDAQSNLDSMYFSGKAIAKFASVIYTMSELLGDRELAATGLGKLKDAFARFSTNQQTNPLVYEEGWSGIISSAGYVNSMADFGNGYYNDHHFHYGYHVFAAAVIGFLDPSWVAENKAYVNSLVRDYANPSNKDPYFPEWRSFDWFHGHSWAHGLFPTSDGKNQESSSEDAMAIYATKMWGHVIGDANLEARSNLQLKVLARSLRHYYLYESDNEVVPTTFARNKVAGILFENKIDHTTFFGANIEYIQGIHMLPLLPVTGLTRSKNFVREEWDAWFSNGRAEAIDSGWRGILVGNLGMIDPQAAWDFFANDTFNVGWIDGGASRTWYLAYAAAMAGDALVVDGVPISGGGSGNYRKNEGCEGGSDGGESHGNYGDQGNYGYPGNTGNYENHGGYRRDGGRRAQAETRMNCADSGYIWNFVDSGLVLPSQLHGIYVPIESSFHPSKAAYEVLPVPIPSAREAQARSAEVSPASWVPFVSSSVRSLNSPVPSFTMANLSRSQIIQSNPIGEGLSAVRESFNSICDRLEISHVEALSEIEDKGLQNLAVDLVEALQVLPAARLLPSRSGSRNLLGDLSRLNIAVNSHDFDFSHIKPLLNAALNNETDDIIWDKVYDAVTESTPPPRSVPIQQTPWLRNTSSFANSSEHRKYVDDVLKEELGPMYVGVPGFFETYFGEVSGLEPAAKAVFEKCKKGDTPLYQEEGGWQDWPESAKERDVLNWFVQLTDQFLDLTAEHSPTTARRRPLAQPHKPLQGSTAERKLDIGFVDDPNANGDSECRWSQILVPGELKGNPAADTASKTWLDLGRYAREVLAAQDTRRFVLGFTLCGSLLRLWLFDRLGGIASTQFDVNQEGLRFVSTVLGFLWMNDEQLGFDPTVKNSDGKRYIEIERDGETERIIIDALMKRAHCVAGRATTCWKGHLEGDESMRPLVIKDSWQYLEREEEGELLREATEKDVINVARYYHHETVHVRGKEDDICNNVRKGLDITKAESRRQGRSMPPSNTTGGHSIRTERSTGPAGRKRSSSTTDAPLPPSKRSCSTSPVKPGMTTAVPNRVRRRVIVHDYGKAIYKSSSPVVLLAALEHCIEGYESLHKQAGMLQCDISPNNLMVNEEDASSWPAFLIDLDLAIKEQLEAFSGARGKTGTRAFMAIGALLGEKHSFMHDLESFFWVLFWICIHYEGPSQERIVPRFEKWNYVDTEELAGMKLGLVAKEDLFLRTVTDNFTLYYKPLIPRVNRLRRKVFPLDKPCQKEDRRLYSDFKDVLRKAREDPEVLARKAC
ncbi:hypothetical protein MKZ38_004229 [Zalerion maritima]|uniref:glucan endo-1,3-beta-D-glucosidase n=1 Tax=Zalerion maritima TaxID=339359 RepID=A0AAD5RMW5_9PEZI|nr:hypothetical protein MKZ38_004229 [Zalerion maritima]